MKLEDIQKTKIDTSSVISIRLPRTYKLKIQKHNINIRKLICKAIDELELK